MAGAPGPIRRAWYQWKMQRFPWRKKWLVGFDLHGNTFWEFKDALHALRNRRIAKYSRSTHYGDVQISRSWPASALCILQLTGTASWVQWLRHTRFDPPSIAEQQQDLVRQERIKMLAAQADAKWAEKPSALDAPDKQQPMLPLQSKDPDSGLAQMNVNQVTVERPGVGSGHGEAPAPTATDNAPAPTPRKRMTKEPKDSPWKQAAQTQDWQPQGWSPAPAKRP
ncbi:NDUFA12 domain containing protein [Curvularia clavata]|uniref:NDUFA12 domain containing protein n=1 Tax=Curvularia clavata TaxID=95742 RepID=A0A9Q9DX71_CURCL|nr:NDUFA12 domain containing protein [Curvularia clavata]